MIVESEDLPKLIRNNLNELRLSSFGQITILIGFVCYAGIVWSFWPTNSSNNQFTVTLVSWMLVALAVVTNHIKDRYLELASLLLVIGTFVGIAILAIEFKATEIVYSFTIPVIFAGVLLGYWAVIVFSIGVIVCSLILYEQSISNNLPLFAAVLQSLIAFAVLISTRNLYIALAWTLNALDSATRNQNIARDRKAELEQAVKSLDMATNRLSQANRALQIARDQAEEARRLKQHFAYSVSHELRTPLNLIVGFAENMIQSPEYYGSVLPPPYMRDLMIVYRNACHLQNLVNDVLDLARLESFQMGLQIVETELRTIVDEVIKTAHGLVEMKGLGFSVEIEPDLPTVWIDPVRVKQIIFNLLNNAVRYTEKGSVSLRVVRQGKEVVFAVSDTGIGIAPENLDRVFEPFQRLGDPMRSQNEGVGLGLTISQRLARLHGGYISVESQVNVGSTFSLHLPIWANEMLPHTASTEKKDSLRAALTKHPRQKLVLLVTRSLSSAAMVKRHLPMCRTLIAQNLDLAKQAIQQMAPQVVIFDTSDECLDGIYLPDIAAEWGLTTTYLIAAPLLGEEVLRRNFDVQSFLVKPVSHDNLWDTLRQFGEAIDNVMIVDDDRDFVRLIERMLDNPLKRYRVSLAYSGREALELMQQRIPDLILLDLEMPDMNGYELIRRMQTIPELQSVRVVIMSGQEHWDTSNIIPGNFTVFKPDGMTPNEILQWLQSLLCNSAISDVRACSNLYY